MNTELLKNIQYVKGVGEKRAELFNKLGVFNADALVHYYPRAYQDKSQLKTVAQTIMGEKSAIKATLISVVSENKIRKGLTLYKCNFTDGQTIIKVTIFNNKYLANLLKIYEDYILFGEVTLGLTYASMSSPQIERFEDADAITPVYRATEKLTSKTIGRIIKNELSNIVFDETLNDKIREKYSLVDLNFAMHKIHFPKSNTELEQAKKRLIFEELLVLNLGFAKLKHKKKSKTGIVLKEDFLNEYFKLLPFELTNAQKNAIFDCVTDMKKGFAMNRLIQGDVGSGKTAVASGVIYDVVKNGFQCALMAPTEILAVQHYETLTNLLSDAGFKVSLLTGSTKAKQKREIKELLMNGQIDLLVGTHAIIQNDVEFKNLGLVITDEQHRFGVEQRANLAMKGECVHTLVMSATPIPRTLALTIYGDLDISVLNELPPGRQKIRTDVVNSTYHQRIYNFIKKAIARGEQAYIVCPLVEDEEEKSELKSAKQYFESLCENDFKNYSLGLLHGKMKAKDKEKVMKDFSDGKTDILVSTTVIEVGVDVPNATVMLIENAERFGLSALHQLRGRIGRGKSQSFCILVSDSKTENAKERLMAMKKTSDGFEIAKLDLKMRGPGDFFGKRQNGLPDLKIADMLTDFDMIELTKNAAEEILEEDFNLDNPKNKLLADKISDMFRENYVGN